ncbi:MAG: hypothetical protein JW950_03975 [Deltaproteobacteria bacterium]|nr:hypothetical protein [Deltaproteobacteria bacterium]
MLKGKRAGVLLVAAAVGLWFLAAGISMAELKSPADFTFEQGKTSPGKVTFSHGKHMVNDIKCTACHFRVFKMKKGSADTSGEAMHNNTACGLCHDGKKSFSVSDENDCATCHRK